ncbi:MAG: glycosyltransferase family 4 protein [Chloroflexota bacterium]|nr:glycosyltransferase family 4 protein [Chloroflexota bacterium]
MLHQRLRIAQIAPLAERVPPRKYGGTERVVAALTDELVRRGHAVTLFATGDSATLAGLVPLAPSGLREMPGLAMPRDLHPFQMMQLGIVFERADAFDLIHSHVDFFTFPFTRLVRTPVLTTMHGRLDLPALPAIFDAYPDAAVNSISLHQQLPLPRARWVGNVYHGIDLSHFHVGDGSGGYFAFLGRITPDKGISEAIEIARRTGIPLKIAAKVDDDHPEYFDLVRTHLDGKLIEWIGEIGEGEKSAFLGNAIALLFPIQWPEPFGLTMIEALACGTPVLATPCGSVPEILVDGVTGFIRPTVDGLVEAVGHLDEIDREVCRDQAEQRFSAPAMATGYERVYQELVAAREPVMLYPAKESVAAAAD